MSRDDEEMPQRPEIVEARASLRSMAMSAVAREFEELLGRRMTLEELDRCLGPSNVRALAALNVLDQLAKVEYMLNLRHSLRLTAGEVVVPGTMSACINDTPHAHVPHLDVTNHDHPAAQPGERRLGVEIAPRRTPGSDAVN